MAGGSRFHWASAARTHVGLVREHNEDACLDQPERGLWAVADGMGGHALGDFASRLVIESLERLPVPDSLEHFIAVARRGLQAANRQLCQEAARRGVPVIGSTVVLLFAWGGQCAYLWAGDSRLYLYRQERLLLLSRDHSQVEELVAQGSLSPEAARHHPARHLITRAVGAAPALEVDAGTLAVRDGDLFLLCSDGLSNELTEAEMAAALAGGDCGQAVAALVDLALAQGGRDNISAVVARADDPDTADRTILNPAFL